MKFEESQLYDSVIKHKKVFSKQLSVQEINYSISLIIELNVVTLKLRFLSYLCQELFVILAEKHRKLIQVHSQTTLY